MRAGVSARFAAAELERFIAGVLAGEGLRAGDAGDVARLMVAADLTGFDAHGIFRLAGYLRRIRGGGVNKAPDIRIAREAASVAVVDGDDGMGHLAVQFAARVAIRKASETGIGWAGIRNGNHAGAGAVYAAMPLEHGMAGIYGAVSSGNHVPPWGGLDLMLGTNPLAIAIPAGDGDPVVLDFATTVASMGRIKAAEQRGEAMPEGWMIDRDGAPLTDPARASDGLLVPMGGYKGYALCLAIGLLAGPLNGAAMGEGVVDYNSDFDKATNTGQFICALDPAAFGDAAAIGAQVERVAGEIRGAAPMPGVDRVRVPGDGRARRLADRRENGIPLPDSLRAALDGIAEETGVAPLADIRNRNEE